MSNVNAVIDRLRGKRFYAETYEPARCDYLDVIRATAAPMRIAVGNRSLWISPPSIRWKSAILVYLREHPRIIADYRATHEDRMPDRDWIPRLSSDLCMTVLLADGFTHLLWAVTRHDHPAMTWEETETLAQMIVNGDDSDIMTAVGLLALVGRPRTSDRISDAVTPRDGGENGYDGFESRDMGRVLVAESLALYPANVVAEMTEDQMFNYLVNGVYSSNGPGAAGTPLSEEQALAYLFASREAIDAGQEPPECPR